MRSRQLAGAPRRSHRGPGRFTDAAPQTAQSPLFNPATFRTLFYSCRLFPFPRLGPSQEAVIPVVPAPPASAQDVFGRRAKRAQYTWIRFRKKTFAGLFTDGRNTRRVHATRSFPSRTLTQVASNRKHWAGNEPAALYPVGSTNYSGPSPWRTQDVVAPDRPPMVVRADTRRRPGNDDLRPLNVVVLPCWGALAIGMYPILPGHWPDLVRPAHSSPTSASRSANGHSIEITATPGASYAQPVSGGPTSNGVSPRRRPCATLLVLVRSGCRLRFSGSGAELHFAAGGRPETRGWGISRRRPLHPRSTKIPAAGRNFAGRYARFHVLHHLAGHLSSFRLPRASRFSATLGPPPTNTSMRTVPGLVPAPTPNLSRRRTSRPGGGLSEHALCVGLRNGGRRCNGSPGQFR